jgi:rhamnogalacturonan acetylesterase
VGGPLRALRGYVAAKRGEPCAAGRSSRTFIKEGAWESALAAIKPGDFVLIQMGHNDGGAVEAEQKSRGTLKGTGEETKTLTWPDGSVEVVTIPIRVRRGQS